MIPPIDPYGPLAIGLIAGAAFLAAVVKGVTTMGLGLVGVTVIAMFMDVQTAVLSMFAAKFVSDAIMLFESKREHAWHLTWRLRWFAVSGVIGVSAATYLLANLPSHVLLLILGATIVAFIALQARREPIRIAVEREQPWGVVFGSVTGILQGLTGIGGPPTAMYLFSMRLTTAEFVFMSCAVYFLFDIGQLAAVLSLDLYNTTRIFYSIAVFVPVMLGTWVGVCLRRRISVTMFRYAVLTVLFITGIGLIVKGLRF